MASTLRIGIQIDHVDPFWVQVREVIWQRARTLAAELIEVTIQDSHLLSTDEQAAAVEDLLLHDIDALICNTYPPSLLTRILDRGIPIVYVGEIALRHPRFTARLGLYDAAQMLGAFLDQRMAGHGTILVVGGQSDEEDTGQSRLDGFAAGFSNSARYTLYHVPTGWLYEEARPRLETYLRDHPDQQFDAIFGLSDSLALAARDASQACARITARTEILGINGDPLALAAIAAGTMTATVETEVDDIATQAVDLARRAAHGEQLPSHFRHRQRLVTAANVAEVAMQKMLSLAMLPTRLVEVNQHSERQRLIQRETSRAIDRQVGLILDEQRLSLAITALIRDSYGFDHARFLMRYPDSGPLVEVGVARDGNATPEVAIAPDGPLAYALAHNQTVFIPDTAASHRFSPDPLLPEVRARVVAPVHLGGQIIGLLDLHRRTPAHHTREELYGVQLLADRLGIAMRNAELYGQELAARALAEKADRLKTMLLASVSHELRTPLNIILGYSQSALDTLAGAGAAQDDSVCQDLTQIYRSGEHLLRLINDLLDLSRAEIDELELLPEPIEMRTFLEAIFEASVTSFDRGGAVAWRLDLPADLPRITADPVRLRQVLLNLLHNAQKFTQHGQITLGASVASNDLHLWVSDTGVGIPAELQEQIFEPFVSIGENVRRREGIGLGLSVSQRLVALHHGRIELESQPGHGSTFHIFLPLLQPEAADTQGNGDRRMLLLITETTAIPAHLQELASRRGLTIHRIRPGDDLIAVLLTGKPALLAWDLATAADDGWSVVEQIRAHPHFGRLPVMLYRSEADITGHATGAATSVFTKPLADTTLVATLNDLELRGSEGSILIVEDDPQARALHRRIIAAHFPDYTIHDVGDGRTAIEILTRETPSLIVLDLIMPEIDGFAVLEALRANPRTLAVPVLVLSGRALSGDDIRRLGAARVVFQTKDVLSETELTESLRRTIARDDILPPQTSALVKQAIAFIQQHYNEPLDRQAIGDAIGVSKDYLGRIFHQEIGLSPWEYLIRYRVLRAKELLLTTGYTIAEVAARVGFDTASYFSHIFHREVGCSPRNFRANPTSIRHPRAGE